MFLSEEAKLMLMLTGISVGMIIAMSVMLWFLL